MLEELGSWLAWIVVGIIVFAIGYIMTRRFSGILHDVGYILYVVGIIVIVIGFLLLIFTFLA